MRRRGTAKKELEGGEWGGRVRRGTEEEELGGED